ncbi:hypothetical protein KDA23_04120 [Candidatus Saccharibacteria bacterium]|nr:hypothetical protein [Candidatus Saccharibacteria bacterium]
MAEYLVVRYMIASRLFRILLAVSMVASVALIVLYRWSSEPVTTTLNSSAEVKATDTNVRYKELRTDYVTIKIPAVWTVKNNSTRATRIQVVAFGSINPRGQIAITSDTLPAGGLSEVGDYHLRVSQTGPYERVTDNSIPSSAEVFLNKGAVNSYTAFVTHGKRYVIITASDTTTSDDALRLLSQSLTDLHWLN